MEMYSFVSDEFLSLLSRTTVTEAPRLESSNAFTNLLTQLPTQAQHSRIPPTGSAPICPFQLHHTDASDELLRVLTEINEVRTDTSSDELHGAFDLGEGVSTGIETYQTTPG